MLLTPPFEEEVSDDQQTRLSCYAVRWDHTRSMLLKIVSWHPPLGHCFWCLGAPSTASAGVGFCGVNCCSAGRLPACAGPMRQPLLSLLYWQSLKIVMDTQHGLDAIGVATATHAMLAS